MDLNMDGRNDLVVKAARIVSPDFFGPPWVDSNGKEPDLCKSRRLYEQSKAYCIAFDVLKLAAKVPNLAELLAQIETEDWHRLGIASEEVEPIVKYATEEAWTG